MSNFSLLIGNVLAALVAFWRHARRRKKIIISKSYYMKISFTLFFITITYLSFGQAGSLDSSFGNGGKVISDYKSDESINSAILQPDGKIIIGGDYDLYPQNNARRLACAVGRYKTNGTPDSAFGKNGLVYNKIGGSFSGIRSVILQKDGKILGAGYANLTGYFNQLMVLRYKAKGSLDSSFGQDGVASYGVDHHSVYGNAIVLQADDKIVVAGTIVSLVDSSAIVVVRFNKNGSVDSSFGYKGRIFTVIGRKGVGQSIILTKDGKIVVGGFGTQANSAITQFALARYTSSGKPDLSFGNMGIAMSNFTGTSEAYAIAQTPNGKIVAAGSTRAGSYNDFALVRFTANGIIDSSFALNGRSVTDLGYSDEITAIAIQPDGKIVVGGYSYDAIRTSNIYFAIVRYKSNGSLDKSFSTNGELFTNFGGAGSAARAILLQPDGKILAAGWKMRVVADSLDFVLARYMGDDAAFEKYEPIISNDLSIKIYPNPVEDVLNIKGLNTMMSYELLIVNEKGTIVSSKQTGNASAYNINVQGLHSSIYYLTIMSNNMKQTIKFVKK